MIVTNVMIVMIVIKDFGNEKNGYVVIYNKIYILLYITTWSIDSHFFFLNDIRDNRDNRDSF